MATVLVVSANSSWKIMQLDRYSLVALLSAFFLGSSISLEKYLLDDIGFDTYALKASGNSSLIISVASFRTSLVVLGSYFLLKERDHIGVKLVGTVIATAGLSLLV